MSNQEDTKALTIQMRGALLHPANVKMLAEQTPDALLKYMTPARVEKIVLGACSRNPKLLTCSRPSMIKAVADLIGLSLEPGGLLGEAYLVPFWNKNTGCFEVQPMPGYKGLLKLARSSGQMRAITSQIVYERDLDEFEIDLASNERPKHPPYLRGDRGNMIGVYCTGNYSDGSGSLTEWMTMDQVEEVRSRSKSKDYGPWVTDYGQMVRKTVAKRWTSYVTLSPDLAAAIEMDNRGYITAEEKLVVLRSTPVEGGMFTEAEQESLPPHDQTTGEVIETQERERVPETRRTAKPKPRAKPQAKQEAKREPPTEPKDGPADGNKPKPEPVSIRSLRVHNMMLEAGMDSRDWVKHVDLALGKKLVQTEEDLEAMENYAADWAAERTATEAQQDVATREAY